MILAIDIGNTNIVFGLFEGDTLKDKWRSPTQVPFPLGHLQNIKAIIVTSVVPDIDESITAICERDLDLSPTFITYKNAGIEITTESPEQVGADRLVNAVAVITHYQAPAIVIDFGTATTFDVITVDKAGGIIAPGIRLSLETLTNRAAKLPKIEIKKPPHAIGRTTSEAMQSGIFYGYLSLIEGVIKNLGTEMQTTPTIIATGGLASLFFDETETIHHLDPDLTLKGLLSVYRTMTEK